MATVRGVSVGIVNTRTIQIDLSERERKDAANARRFPVSVSSENPVPRRDWATGQVFAEVLSHKAGAVDLSRAPLPVLEGHDRTRTNVGIVQGLRLDGARLRGELVLGASQRAGELAEDIAAGIVTGLSVGYQIAEEKRDEKAKRITATRWVPYEVSIVPIPADTTVGINRSHHMDEQATETTTTTQTQTVTAPPPPAPEVLAERERTLEIQALVTRSGLGGELAAEMVRTGATVDRARAIILDRLAARDEASMSRRSALSERSVLGAGEDYGEDFRRATIDALLLRAGIPVAKPHAAAHDVSTSVYDIARTCLSRAGQRSDTARGPALLKRAATTSDFPAILEGALHASVRNGYENEPASHRAWVRVAPFQDFRAASRPILGSAPDLAKINEGGEYTNGYFSDDGTSYSIDKYGKIVALTWEAIVNDNLGAFLRVQPALGQAARRLEADVVYALFPLNTGAGPTMNDTKALFHADHGNLVSPAATFDASLLGAGRALLRKQKAVGGGYLSLVPRFLIVPSERETAAEILLANAARPAAGPDRTVGAWIASLELVVEPRLASTAAYLAADSAQIDTIELGLLEENLAGPHMETEQGFDTDETRWKVRHTAGAKALDYRGMVKMPISG